jgi:hypothetical protein
LWRCIAAKEAGWPADATRRRLILSMARLRRPCHSAVVLFSYAPTPTFPSVQLLTLPTCLPRLASHALCLTTHHSLPQLLPTPRLKHRPASLPPSNLLETWNEAHAARQHGQILCAALLILLEHNSILCPTFKYTLTIGTI